MKKLKATYITDNFNDVETLHSFLNAQEKHPLEFHLWKNGNDRPEVFFSLAHDDDSALLKFFVEEKEIRAIVTKTNGPVWEDSCVEFFVSFDENGYYNFEFNCLGTVLAAFGSNRNDRRFLPADLLQQVETHTILSKKKNRFYWEMLIVIPAKIFMFHSLQLRGTVCSGNFYKCGDGLTQPHYLVWNNIESPVPDFHLPKFFGEIYFE